MWKAISQERETIKPAMSGMEDPRRTENNYMPVLLEPVSRPYAQGVNVSIARPVMTSRGASEELIDGIVGQICVLDPEIIIAWRFRDNIEALAGMTSMPPPADIDNSEVEQRAANKAPEIEYREVSSRVRRSSRSGCGGGGCR